MWHDASMTRFREQNLSLVRARLWMPSWRIPRSPERLWTSPSLSWVEVPWLPCGKLETLWTGVVPGVRKLSSGKALSDELFGSDTSHLMLSLQICWVRPKIEEKRSHVKSGLKMVIEYPIHCIFIGKMMLFRKCRQSIGKDTGKVWNMQANLTFTIWLFNIAMENHHC